MEDYEDSRLKIEEGVKKLAVPRPHVYRATDLVVTYSQVGVPIRVYQPSPSTGLPVVYYVHGGAWVGGSIETHDNVCRSLCNFVPCVVISVDYRRAPEYKFPASLDDCYAVLKWLLKSASELRSDMHRLALVGDSAGGNLVAALCMVLRDEGSVDEVLTQVLVNPALDLRRKSRTYQTYGKYVRWYLGDYGRQSALVCASPLAASNFRGLPKAFIVTCENDELKTEGQRYCEALVNAGVEASLHQLKGVGHLGVHWAAGSAEAGEALACVVKELRTAFERLMQSRCYECRTSYSYVDVEM